MIPIPSSSVPSTSAPNTSHGHISSTRLREILNRVCTSMDSLDLHGTTYASSTPVSVTIEPVFKAMILCEAKQLISSLANSHFDMRLRLFDMYFKLIDFEIEINPPAARESLQQWKIWAEQDQDLSIKDLILSRIVEKEVKFDLPRAIKTAEQIQDPRHRSRAFYEIVIKEIKVDIESAKARIQHIHDVSLWNFAAIELVKEAVKSGKDKNFCIKFFGADFACKAYLEFSKVVALSDLQRAKKNLEMAKTFACKLDSNLRSSMLRAVITFEMTLDLPAAKETTLRLPNAETQAAMFLKIASFECECDIDPTRTLGLVFERIKKMTDDYAADDIYLEIVEIAAEMKLQMLPLLITAAEDVYLKDKALLIAISRKRISHDVAKNILEDVKNRINSFEKEDQCDMFRMVVEIELELGLRTAAFETLKIAKSCALQIDDFYFQIEYFLEILYFEALSFPETIQASIQQVSTFFAEKGMPERLRDDFSIDITEILATINPQWAKESIKTNPRLKDEMLLYVAEAEGKIDHCRARETAAEIEDPLIRIKALFSIIRSMNFRESIRATAE